MRKKKVAFTGHRPESLSFGRSLNAGRIEEFKIVLCDEIRREMDEGCDTFYCGGARGIDLLCGEIVLEEKADRHPDVQLICVIPYEQQDERWGQTWKERYRSVLCGADSIRQICDSYQRDCFHIRNRYMVDACDLLIAVYNGKTTGGTAYTVQYAIKQGKEVVIINPDTFEKKIISARSSIRRDKKVI